MDSAMVNNNDYRMNVSKAKVLASSFVDDSTPAKRRPQHHHPFSRVYDLASRLNKPSTSELRGEDKIKKILTQEGVAEDLVKDFLYQQRLRRAEGDICDNNAGSGCDLRPSLQIDRAKQEKAAFSIDDLFEETEESGASLDDTLQAPGADDASYEESSARANGHGSKTVPYAMHKEAVYILANMERGLEFDAHTLLSQSENKGKLRDSRLDYVDPVKRRRHAATSLIDPNSRPRPKIPQPAVGGTLADSEKRLRMRSREQEHGQSSSEDEMARPAKRPRRSDCGASSGPKVGWAEPLGAIKRFSIQSPPTKFAGGSGRGASHRSSRTHLPLKSVLKNVAITGSQAAATSGIDRHSHGQAKDSIGKIGDLSFEDSDHYLADKLCDSAFKPSDTMKDELADIDLLQRTLPEMWCALPQAPESAKHSKPRSLKSDFHRGSESPAPSVPRGSEVRDNRPSTPYRIDPIMKEDEGPGPGPKRSVPKHAAYAPSTPSPLSQEIIFPDPSPSASDDPPGWEYDPVAAYREDVEDGSTAAPYRDWMGSIGFGIMT